MSPNLRGWGHIDFDADPISVGVVPVSVSVSHFLVCTRACEPVVAFLTSFQR